MQLYTSCVQGSNDSQEQEMDMLLKASDQEREMDALLQTSDYLNSDPHTNSSQAYNYMTNSPLLPGSERSPLLGSPGFVCDDTTSEETLSDHGDPGDPEELEELLLGAGEYQGSFSSVASSTSYAKWNPSSKRSSSDSNAHVQVLPDRALFSYSNYVEPERTYIADRIPVSKPKHHSYHKPQNSRDSSQFDRYRNR